MTTVENEQPPRTGVRGIEAPLLWLSAAFILVNFVALAIVEGRTEPAFWSHLIVWLLCAFIGQRWLDRNLPNRDPLLFPLALFLSGWGLILIDRLATPFADRQSLWLILGLLAMLMVATVPNILRWLRRYRYLLLIAGLILLLSTILLGRNPSGVLGAPQLWLSFDLFLFQFSFQPSEMLKIVLVAFLASYLSEQYPGLRSDALETDRRDALLSPRVIGPILLMWAVSILILVWQRDLGTAVLFFIVFLVLLYTASGSLLILLSGSSLILLAGWVAYHLISVVQQRVDIWLNPWLEADGRAYQVVQSLMAFAAGGIFGTGVGQGNPGFIPVSHSDFIFAALAEEWGLLGVIVLLVCFATLVARGYRTALQQQSNAFYALMAVGLSTSIAAQSIMIMGGVLKIMPLTGVTLPFVSYGGSSLLVSYVMIGLLLRLSARRIPSS